MAMADHPKESSRNKPWSEPGLQLNDISTKSSDSSLGPPSCCVIKHGKQVQTGALRCTCNTCCRLHGCLRKNLQTNKRGHTYPRLREKLQVKVVSIQLEESVRLDEDCELETSLTRASTLHDALSHYAHCLELQTRAGHRLQQLVSLDVNQGYFNQAQIGEDVDEDIKEDLEKLLTNVTQSVDIMKQLMYSVEQHKLRKEEFAIASHNFLLLLSNKTLSNSQLKKLDKQYTTIMTSYKQSKFLLDKQMPKVMILHKEHLSQCFHSLSSCLEKMSKKHCHLKDLFNELNKNSVLVVGGGDGSGDGGSNGGSSSVAGVGAISAPGDDENACSSGHASSTRKAPAGDRPCCSCGCKCSQKIRIMDLAL